MSSWQNCKCKPTCKPASLQQKRSPGNGLLFSWLLNACKVLLRLCWIIFENFFSISSFLALGFAIIIPTFGHLFTSIWICGYNAILGKMNELKKAWTHISSLISRHLFHSGLIPVKITTTDFENRLDNVPF